MGTGQINNYAGVAEAYTTQPNSKASSRVLYMYFSCMAGWPLEQREVHGRVAYVGAPTRMRSNAVGGGDSYFMLGVGGCNYDASTRASFLCAGIFKQSMGARNRVGIRLSYRPARLHSMGELVPRNRFFGSSKVLKFGLCMLKRRARNMVLV